MESNMQYANKYMENAVETAKDLVVTVIQLKTNNALLSDALEASNKKIAQLENLFNGKVGTIEDLNTTIKGLEEELSLEKHKNEELTQSLNKALGERNALATKASHIDTFTKEIKRLKHENELLQPKKKIKKKSKQPVEIYDPGVTPETETKDGGTF